MSAATDNPLARLQQIVKTGHQPEPLTGADHKIMRKYQRLHGLQVTGQFNEETFKHMREMGVHHGWHQRMFSPGNKTN